MGITHCEKCGHVWDAGFLDLCPRCRQMDRVRDELRAVEQSTEARHQAEMRARREAEEAADQRHREQLAATEEEREARYAQARATREAIAAADDRQRNAPRLIAEGEIQRARKCMEIGDLESCSKHAFRAVEADATFAPGRALLAIIHHRKGDTAASLREAEIAFKLAPNAVVNELAEFYSPASHLMEERRQEKLRAEALARAEAEQAQKRREIEQQAAAARQAEIARQAVADRQDALTEQWRAAANKMYWSGLGVQTSVSLLAAVALFYLMLSLLPAPLRWGGIVLFGGVIPWASMSVLTAFALRSLKVEPGEADEETPSTDRSGWKWTVGPVAGFALFFALTSLIWGIGNERCRQEWEASHTVGNYSPFVVFAWLTPLVAAIATWTHRWRPIRARIATTDAPIGLDLVALDAPIYGGLIASLLIVVPAVLFGGSSPQANEITRWYSFIMPGPQLSLYNAPSRRADDVYQFIEERNLFPDCWREETRSNPLTAGVVHAVLRPELAVDSSAKFNGRIRAVRYQIQGGRLVEMPDDDAINQRLMRCLANRTEPPYATLSSGEAVCRLNSTFPVRNELHLSWEKRGVPSALDLAITTGDIEQNSLVVISAQWNPETTQRDGEPAGYYPTPPGQTAGIDVLIENGRFDNPTRQRFRWEPDGREMTFAYIVPRTGRLVVLAPRREALNAPVYTGAPIERIDPWNSYAGTEITYRVSYRTLKVRVYR